jgi:putative ABC transport system permease protein
VGLTRAELLRLLLAEAVLLSLVGVALGVGFGLLLATNAKHLYSVALGFDPPLVLPWDLIGLAAVIVVVLGLLATIVPAALAARKEPLALLQAGRAAT